MLEIKFHDKVDDKLLKIAVIIAKTDGKWVFCKHKDRDTYEVPAGHREDGESIVETAKRELREETGAIEYTIKPVSAYSVKDSGIPEENIDGKAYGMLFVAEISSFQKELHYEIEKIVILETLTDQWTYPVVQPRLIEEARARGFL